ncbi:MAG TPA: chain-length determining protein [Desulfuromonadales bacterium]|nr:chain-length determining protein [Desulfuromonadales bacterium]
MASNELDYKKYLNLIQRDKKISIISALIIMTLVTIGCYLMPNKYEATSTVFIEKSVIAELIKGLAVTPSVEEKIKALTYVLNSRTLITKVIDELNFKASGEAEQEKLIKNLQANTQIKIKDREGLFIISFQDKNPKIARDYVNTLVRKYIDENLSSKRDESYGATQFLSEQLSAFRDKLLKTEETVNEFKRGAGSIATMDPTNLLKDISDSQQRADELKIRQAQLETAVAGLGRVNSAHSNLPALQKRLLELQLQYTDNYPEIIKIKDDIRALEEQHKSGKGIGKASETPEYERLLSELRAVRQAESNLRANIARNRSLLDRIPAAKSKLDDLEREKSSQKALYESMVSRQGQSEVSKQMQVQDKSTTFRIVDPAILPIKPVSPNRVKLILLGIVAGIGAGLGLVILKDQLDTSVKDVETAKSFGIPLLAVIPRIENPEFVALQTTKDRRLYIFAGLYFSIILAALASEVAGITVLSRLVSMLSN